MKKTLIIFSFILLFSTSIFAKEQINVAFCIDNNYPLYTMLLINSILLNNKSQSDYTFYVVNNNVSLWNKLRMYSYVKLRGQKIKFININTDDIDNKQNLFSKNETTKHVSRIGTARILLPNLLPKEIEKILYLDSDMLVTSDLKELYDIPLDDYYAAMTLDVTLADKSKNSIKKSNYCNSGMILMNLPLWRENNLPDKLINVIKTIDFFNFIDQDAINFVLGDNIKILSPRYNNCALDGYTMIKIEEKEEYIIIHYVTSSKPWTDYKEYKYFNIYYYYWGRSGLLIEKMMLVLKYYYNKFIVDNICSRIEFIH